MTILDRLLNDWDHQVIYEHDGIIKVYRCRAESPDEAKIKCLEAQGLTEFPSDVSVEAR